MPCTYTDCVCSFKTQVALKNHLLKHEAVTGRAQNPFVPKGSIVTYQLKCEVWKYSELCTLKDYFVHLRGHIKS